MIAIIALICTLVALTLGIIVWIKIALSAGVLGLAIWSILFGLIAQILYAYVKYQHTRSLW